MKNIILLFALMLASPSDLFASKSFESHAVMAQTKKKKKKGLFKSKKKCKCPKIK